jgi:hypothetical protein
MEKLYSNIANLISPADDTEGTISGRVGFSAFSASKPEANLRTILYYTSDKSTHKRLEGYDPGFGMDLVNFETSATIISIPGSSSKVSPDLLIGMSFTAIPRFNLSRLSVINNQGGIKATVQSMILTSPPVPAETNEQYETMETISRNNPQLSSDITRQLENIKKNSEAVKKVKLARAAKSDEMDRTSNMNMNSGSSLPPITRNTSASGRGSLSGRGRGALAGASGGTNTSGRGRGASGGTNTSGRSGFSGRGRGSSAGALAGSSGGDSNASGRSGFSGRGRGASSGQSGRARASSSVRMPSTRHAQPPPQQVRHQEEYNDEQVDYGQEEFNQEEYNEYDDQGY